MKIGLGRQDITPRVGVELCGFGPFLCRKSVGVRDKLWARALAAEHAGARAVILSCDLIGITSQTTRRVRKIMLEKGGLPAEAVMVACTHTHSGPTTADLIGWGVLDQPYLETLPQRIAQAGLRALADLGEAELSHAETPCEGIGLNREYDRDAPPLAEVLAENWRPAKPELTDTKCHVFRIDRSGKTAGFFSYFGCHPVVCCESNRYIHGDYCGVANALLESEHPGSIGFFLQGANGDVNSCVAHKPEADSLRALDVIAARYARAVSAGLKAAVPVKVDRLRCLRREVAFSRKPWSFEKISEMLAEKQKLLSAPDATDESRETRMQTVYLEALRRLLARAEAGASLALPLELQGVRFGPVALLAGPFETMQAIKNDVVAGACADVPLVLSVTNDFAGYAPDHTCAKRGGYAADVVPMMVGQLPFNNVHDELARELLALDEALERV